MVIVLWTARCHVSRIPPLFFSYRLTLYLTAITMDDDLTPLERARRRKNKLAGA